MHKNLGNLGLSSFRRKDENRRSGYKLIFTKPKLLIETFTQEVLAVVTLRETESDYQDESIFNLWLVWPIRFPFQGTKCIVWQASNFL